MTTETKSIVVEKMDDAGHGLARLATLSSIDHDGDTYASGAFGWKEGGDQWVSLLPAHDRSKMPFGKARVHEDGDIALAELHLNLDSEAGREWHSHLKFDLAKGRPVQEWSYGFTVLDAAKEVRGEEPVRVLKRLDVHEVSAVVRGAGIGTSTLAMKSRGSFAEQIEATLSALDDLIDRAGDVARLRGAEGRGMSKARVAQFVELKARLDQLIGATTEVDGDPLAEALAADWLTRDARRRAGR